LIFDEDDGSLVKALVIKIGLYCSITWESQEGFQPILHPMERYC
jgi:hypothetical protein